MNITQIFSAVGLGAILFSLALPAEEAPQTEEKPQGEKSRRSESNVVRSMDGVVIEALEAYPRIKSNQLSLGLGVYPFDEYYDGLSVNLGYTYHFDDDLAWEVLHGSYFFAFQKSLTSQLAQLGKVQPSRIYRLQYIVMSNAVYTPILGKFVFSKKNIRYFRMSILGGAGVVSASEAHKYTSPKVAAGLGLRFTTVINDSFSFGFEVRDAIAVMDFDNFVTFGLSSSYNF